MPWVCVNVKSGYFEYGISIYQWHSNILVDIMLTIWLLLIISRWLMVRNKAVFCLEVVIYKLLQIWRHNYGVSRNECVIFTFSESSIPKVYSLQFLFKYTHHSWRYGRKCEWVFFSEHSVYRTQSIQMYASGVEQRYDTIRYDRRD